LAGATQASAFFTASRSGAVGRLLSPYYQQKLVLCSAYDDNSRYVTAGGTRIKPAWKYRARTQTIRGIARLEYWNDVRWVTSGLGAWHSQRVRPGGVARLVGHNFLVPRTFYWRVAMRYQWRIAGRLVGTRVYYFEAGDYYPNDARFPTQMVLQGEILIGATADGESSWCYLP
jgi:hypothetical protein